MARRSKPPGSAQASVNPQFLRCKWPTEIVPMGSEGRKEEEKGNGGRRQNSLLPFPLDIIFFLSHFLTYCQAYSSLQGIFSIYTVCEAESRLMPHLQRAGNHRGLVSTLIPRDSLYSGPTSKNYLSLENWPDKVASYPSLPAQEIRSVGH